MTILNPVIAITILLLLAGCAEERIVCNKPYIRYSTSCCLDVDNNKICDSDETTTTTTTTTTSTSTSTTTTTSSTTTTSTTTTTTQPLPELCGKEYCALINQIDGTCMEYDKINEICINATSYTLCDNLTQTFNCSKEAYCYMNNKTGAACKQTTEQTRPSNTYYPMR